ncbi:MAG: HAD-IIB family hydrolase [Trueperaceae bacterium]
MTTPEETEPSARSGLYVVMYSVHGLIRGHDLELGRDADTGGQTKYVVELARALAQRPEIDAVDLVTRRIEDAKVSDIYAEEFEDLGDGARIVRLRFGGGRYRQKETLWPYLDELVAESLRFFRAQGRLPDLLHGHYADAGDVARELAARLGVPLIVTGHSLGRNKRQVLERAGVEAEAMEQRYRLGYRIDVEERLLRDADLVIASTRHEVERGYELYDASKHATFEVLAPGIDVDRFYPYYHDLDEGFDPGEAVRRARVRMRREIARFLNRPEKPLILAVSRPDKRKNIEGLVTAYGEDPELQQMANLAVFAGVRKDIREMSDNEREVLTELLLLMDRYDLYGKMALPKRHEPDVDIPVLYRIAAASGGVFINPALVENFGITLIEAASSGLPIVSTDHGGPKDIVAATDAGLLVDARDTEQIQTALRTLLVDREAWERHSAAGVEGVRRTFSWSAHAEHYLAAIEPFLDATPPAPWRSDVATRLRADRPWLISDVDHTLVDDEADGDPEALTALARDLRTHGAVFGVATGRSLALLDRALGDHALPPPAVAITDVGTAIHYARHDGDGDGPRWIEERAWAAHIRSGWDAGAVAEALARVRGLEPQPDEARTDVKLSYLADDALAMAEHVRSTLRDANIKATVVGSRGHLLDVLPPKASKGKAIKWLTRLWGARAERVAVAGDSGNDLEMLTGPFRGIVVGNHAPELDTLRGRRGVHVSEAAYAAGVREGLRAWGLLDG